MHFQLPMLLALASAASATWMISGYTQTGCGADYDDDDYGDDREGLKICQNFLEDFPEPILSTSVTYTQGRMWAYMRANCTGPERVELKSNGECTDYTDIDQFAGSVGSVLYWGNYTGL